MTKKIELKENEILALNVRLDYFGNNLFYSNNNTRCVKQGDGLYSHKLNFL